MRPSCILSRSSCTRNSQNVRADSCVHRILMSTSSEERERGIPLKAMSAPVVHSHGGLPRIGTIHATLRYCEVSWDSMVSGTCGKRGTGLLRSYDGI